MLHVSVEGKINPATGFVKDFADISTAVKPLVENLDHRHLGQWASFTKDGVKTLEESKMYEWNVAASPMMATMAPVGWDMFLYPSSENLLWWIGRQLKADGLDWAKLALEETCTSFAELSREEFESAPKS